jgi:Carboxypeptidase regulatory-like domain
MKTRALVLSLTILALLILTLGLGTALQADVPHGTMAGTVVDAHGKPVAGATVTMQTSDGAKPYATHTDASGHFEFVRYQPGQYDLRAYWKGMFSDWTKRVSIKAKKTTEVTLRMPPAADESVTVSAPPQAEPQATDNK